MTLAMSWAIFWRTAAGAPLGAASTTKELCTKSLGPPASAEVGTSAICGMRLGPATAR